MDPITSSLYSTTCIGIAVSSIVAPWYYYRRNPLPPAASRRQTIAGALDRPEVCRALALTGVVHVPMLFAVTVLSVIRNNPLTLTLIFGLTTVASLTATGLYWALANCTLKFTVTASLNASLHGLACPHTATNVTTAEGTQLRLVFNATTVTTPQKAAKAAYDVANHRTRDDIGQTWPTGIRTLDVGDVLTVTTPRAYASASALNRPASPRAIPPENQPVDHRPAPACVP
ncbi:hypothetical protein ACFWGI_37960 [Streptomyces niveus]|uniref:hypothetical protein n=1 Tax=Streptomyces niveus TaxID=193462 RepID=UPI00365A59EF